MKTLLAVILAGLSTGACAGILAGPTINPGNGHIYYLVSQNTWSNSEAEAVSLGGHLATIRNAAENQWIFFNFGPYGGALWIGLTDREKVSSFKWSSGEPLKYTNWAGGQPDNGDGVEFYVHMLPGRHYLPGKWNDYANVETVLAEQFPLYGVVEIAPASTIKFSLSTSPTEAQPEASAPIGAALPQPELHISTAIELTWLSQTNTIYEVQWTPSLDRPEWVSLGPRVLGTGTNISLFDSTRHRPHGFYRIQVMQ
jgi:hypothetical protein